MAVARKVSLLSLTEDERDRLLEALDYAVWKRDVEEFHRLGGDRRSAQFAAWTELQQKLKQDED